MSYETVSEEGQEDYEIWTCDTCGYQITLNGVGGDVCECPRCISREYAQEAEQERENEITQKKFVVLLSKYPEKFEIVASNKEEARAKAKAQVNWTIWESEVEEVDAFADEIPDEKKYN